MVIVTMEKKFKQAVIHALRAGFVLAVAILLLHGCTPPQSGYYYVVKQDETLADIAKAHQIDTNYLTEVNNLEGQKTVRKGTVLFIPDGAAPPLEKRPDDGRKELLNEERKAPSENLGATGSPKKAPEVRVLDGSLADKTAAAKSTDTEKKVTKTEIRDTEKAKTEQESKKPAEPTKPAVTVKSPEQRFIWPARGKIISSYGPQKNGMFYNGISIEVPRETTIVAAADGLVIFSAPLKDYGETVIIRHADQYATVYTNLTKSLVQPDRRVKQGESIATVSPSGKGTSSFEFEIRHNNKARDPIPLLSP